MYRMLLGLGHKLASAFAPPHYLAPPSVGIDISTSAVKIATVSKTAHGLVLSSHADLRLPPGAFVEGDFVDRAIIVETLSSLAHAERIGMANVSLPEAKSYLFETTVPGGAKEAWRTAVEPRLDELIPLPPAEAVFDILPVGKTAEGEMRVAGVGYARRIVEEALGVFDEAHITIQALEAEMFAAARAVLPQGDESTVMIVDVGRTTIKLAIVAKRTPRFSTTIGFGGHALTLAVQKHFGVTEEEARRVKVDRGIVSSSGNEDYIAAMFSTISAIKDEIVTRLNYWQGKASPGSGREPITRVVLTGGNVSIRGFPEYLEGVLKIPVSTGDVFTNFASRDIWLPSLPANEALAYATAIGLALRDHVS